MRILAILLFFFFLTPAVSYAHVDPNDPSGTHHASDGAAAEIMIEKNVFAEDPMPHLTQITIYILIALGGIVAGSIGTFILLTMTLHPKGK